MLNNSEFKKNYFVKSSNISISKHMSFDGGGEEKTRVFYCFMVDANCSFLFAP